MIEFWIIGGILFLFFGLIVLRGAPYVPTHQRQLESLFSEVYPLSEKDIVLDLGSGDGRVLLTAVQKRAGAIGYELNPLLVWWSRVRLRRYPRARVQIADYLLVKDIPRAVSVIYAFSTSQSIKPIERKLVQWSHYRQLDFISYGFQIPGRAAVRSVGPMHVYRFESDKT